MEIMISLEKAKQILSNYPLKEELEEVSLIDAHERILGKDIFAKINQPPFDRSPLDGFAVRGEDLVGASKESPKLLEIVDEIFAGDYSDLTLKQNQAIRIMTGAPMPKGSNCVIRQEDTLFDDTGDIIGNTVEVFKEIKPFSNYCHAGEDIKKGTHVLEKNTLLNHSMIGILASLGERTIKVKKKIKVGLMCIGDELVDLSKNLTEGKIYNSNQYTLVTRLREIGMEPIIIKISDDSIKGITNEVQKVYNTLDILISTGGASVGKKDITRLAFESMEAKTLFWKVDIQPGTPIVCSTLDDKLIINLSGNPGAALVTFEVLVKSHLQRLDNTFTEKAIFKGEFNKLSKRKRFIRGFVENVEGINQVTLTSTKQSSGVLSTSITSNCLIELTKGSRGIKDKEIVKIERI